MEKRNSDSLRLQELRDSLQEIISVLIVLETDMSVENPDGIYGRVIKIIHRMLVEVQHTVEELIQSTKERTE